MAAYATSAEAQTYFDSRLNTSAWDNATSGDKTKSLAMATTIIDRLNFHGDKTDPDQANQFPRDGDDTVPDDIKYATAELALALLDGVNPDLEYENLFMTSQGYSSVRSSYDRSIKPAHILAGIPSIAAWMFLKPYLIDPLQVDFNRIS